MIFIALEGIDASGKATNAKKLHDWFKERVSNVTLLSFPNYQTVTGEMISGHLMGDWHVELSPKLRIRLYDHQPAYISNPSSYAFQCCQVANRMESLPDGIQQHNPEDVYIADRYNASAYAYGLAKGLDLNWLVKVHRFLPQPDLNIFLDISVEESFRRRPERRDNYEKNVQLLESVRNCYLDVFNKLGSRYVIIDATDDLDSVFKKILQAIVTAGLV